jgi:hypothetical protein
MIWYVRRAAATALLAGLLLHVASQPAAADDRTTFSGCVTERTEKAITLNTSADETVTVDTTWLKPDALDEALQDCVTVTSVTIEGRYVAESIVAGDEKSQAKSERERRDEQDDDKDGNKNDD